MWNLNEGIPRIAARLGLMLLIWMSAGAVNAQTGCRYADDNPYGAARFDTVVPLNITDLTIGRDVPDGTVLYRQTIYARNYTVFCPSSVTSTTTNRYLPVTPQKLSTWNTGTYGGKVYQTGVQGIGIAIWWAAQVYPISTTSPHTGNITYILPGAFDISLIKIGPVSPGTITGTNLPTAQYDISGGGSTVALTRTSFTGNIRIVAKTCATPDVNVVLGEHKVSEFPSVGSATPWKRFDIKLQNCPAFYGASAYVANTNNGGTGWVESSRTVTPNALKFSLEATNGTAAIYPGTVRLSPASSGPASATGIGVQIADASGMNVSFGATSWMDPKLTLTATDGANYTIPLQARYIRITGTPAPGPANAAVLFNINYQ